MISNVPEACDRKDLPRVAWRIGRSWERGPNSFEAVVAWSLNPQADPFERAYLRQVGLAVTFPVIRGRFSIRVTR